MVLNTLYVILAAVAGGFFTSMSGYLGSGESWDWKKFGSSMIAMFVAAITMAVTLDFAGVTDPVMAYVLAFLAGAGIEVGTHRLAKAVVTKSQKDKTE